MESEIKGNTILLRLPNETKEITLDSFMEAFQEVIQAGRKGTVPHHRHLNDILNAKGYSGLIGLVKQLYESMEGADKFN